MKRDFSTISFYTYLMYISILILMKTQIIFLDNIYINCREHSKIYGGKLKKMLIGSVNLNEFISLIYIEINSNLCLYIICNIIVTVRIVSIIYINLYLMLIY